MAAPVHCCSIAFLNSNINIENCVEYTSVENHRTLKLFDVCAEPRTAQNNTECLKKNGILWKNGHNYLGVFWKIQDICYIMGTGIFKIVEEMTEKMKP